jgi:hypothetical protein
MNIDHIVILVDELNASVKDYTARGFTVTPGGEHTGGATHNALITFADGAYLELLAFKVPGKTEHRWDRYRPYPGVIDYCLGGGNLDATVATINARGLAYTAGPETGRLRPDGVALRWRSAMPPSQNLGLPFIIEDLTPRELRVPAGENWQHANGVAGVDQLEVLVTDEAEARKNFEALLGQPARPGDGLAFDLNGAALRVAAPAAGSNAAHLATARGAAPWRLTLRTTGGGTLVI